MASTMRPAACAGAIAALCDHAATMVEFFDRALRQPVKCDRFDIFYDAVRPELRRDPGSAWSSDTAADWCGRAAVDAAVEAALRRGREPIRHAPIVEAARSRFRDLDAERKTLLKTASKLHADAVRECLDRGLTDTACRAVEHLGDVLRGLRDVCESDEWTDYRLTLSDAIHKARVWSAKGAAAASQTRQGNGAGGRPLKWSDALKRRILKDHATYLKVCKRNGEKPRKQTAWVTSWATEDEREMSRRDALLLWQAAKRAKYR
jgi:hypothetical protein